MNSPGPLGILGGTFDPVHRAHLHLARAALRQLRLEAVRWIPAGQPSHRHAPHAAAEHRLAMVRLAVADEPRFTVDTGDVESGAPSYTVPTLERLRRQYGEERPLVLVVGADAFLGLPSWHRWQDIFRLAHVAVAARPGAEIVEAALAPPLADIFRSRRRQFTALATAPAGTIVDFEIEPVEPPDLSATMVREHLRNGNTGGLADLLPPGVLDYILRNHLYSA